MPGCLPLTPAAPEEVRGCKANYVELPEDPIREALSDNWPGRRDQLKHMIHAEDLQRPRTVRLAALRRAIVTHLEALRAEDEHIYKSMLELVRQRLDLKRDRSLLVTIKGIGAKSALGFAGLCPRTRPDRQQGGRSPDRRRSIRSQKRDHGRARANPWGPGRRPQHPLYGRRHRQQAQSGSATLLRPAHCQGQLPKSPSSPSCAASSSLPTPCSSPASHGKELPSLDNQHGRFRARAEARPGMTRVIQPDGQISKTLSSPGCKNISRRV